MGLMVIVQICWRHFLVVVVVYAMEVWEAEVAAAAFLSLHSFAAELEADCTSGRMWSFNSPKNKKASHENLKGLSHFHVIKNKNVFRFGVTLRCKMH